MKQLLVLVFILSEIIIQSYNKFYDYQDCVHLANDNIGEGNFSIGFDEKELLLRELLKLR